MKTQANSVAILVGMAATVLMRMGMTYPFLAAEVIQALNVKQEKVAAVRKQKVQVVVVRAEKKQEEVHVAAVREKEVQVARIPRLLWDVAILRTKEGNVEDDHTSMYHIMPEPLLIRDGELPMTMRIKFRSITKEKDSDW